MNVQLQRSPAEPLAGERSDATAPADGRSPAGHGQKTGGRRMVSRMVKRTQPVPLSPRQIEIMNIVWDRGKASVAEVWEVMSARYKVARNTVQTLMTRLEEKGWLGHFEEGPAFRYFARRRRETTLRGMVEQMVDTVFAGSADSLVMALLESRGVSSEEAERIRTMIAQAERSQP